jgi:hypothetical protein
LDALFAFFVKVGQRNLQESARTDIFAADFCNPCRQNVRNTSGNQGKHRHIFGRIRTKDFCFCTKPDFFCTKSISNFPTNPRTFAEVLKPIKVQANEKIDLEKTS